ncbi:MAG: tetratricopeptide repeat protein [Opitutaceae bacterium]|jgi:tetratricopeptide (TPR) repeat protein|nr:tetratricopeptide repeat protein [Opitutaceae bacterium]
MNFFKKIFGGKKGTPPPVPASASDRPPVSSAPAPAAPATDPAKDPNLIRVHDAYGREMFITRQQWRDNILLGNLKQNRDRPDDLAGIIVQSLHDGFAADILPYAAHLATIDPTPGRGHVLHAVTLLTLKRYADAETVLLRFCQQHGETGIALTNLAKIYAGRGDDARALQTLWRALTLDPNQDNGLGWYEVIHREKDGPASGLDALRRIAALPGAWRARLWIARHHLEQRDLPAALALYAEALDAAPIPVPADLLQQMSGDLGNHAHLPELIQLTTPHYDIALHGLPTGNNLIKAHLDLGQLDAARGLLDRLYAQNRPDWKQTLSFWDTGIAKARVAIADYPTPEKLEVTLLTLAGPIWLPPGTPAAELFPAKPADAPVVAFLGASAEMPPGSGEPHRLQLADGPGHLSRALPLWLAEQVEFGTEATTRTIVPWLVKPSPGFVLSSEIWNDADAAAHTRHVRSEEKPADCIVITHLNCRVNPWAIELRLVRTIDAACLATASATCPASDPAQALSGLTRTLLAALATHAEINASPPVSAFSPQTSGAYLLRLEQLLAVRTAAQAQASGTLSGEREILDGHLQLCLDQPESVSIRLLFAQTLRDMKKVRAGILPEFRSRVDLLQKEKPLPEPSRSVVARIIAEALAP